VADGFFPKKNPAAFLARGILGYFNFNMACATFITMKEGTFWIPAFAGTTKEPRQILIMPVPDPESSIRHDFSYESID
jgi:hypothetical protein